MPAHVLEIKDLRCSFGSTMALRGIDMTVAAGEVVALLGANGAGKSTLIKILAGIVSAGQGEVVLDGQRFSAGVPVAAGRAHGLAFVHQDLGLVGSLTVAENIALVAGYRCRGGLVSWRRQRAFAETTLGRLGLSIDPDSAVDDLEPARQALVAIARALAVDARLLVLDEPTAALSAHDSEILFEAVERLRDHGVGILYVTHRLAEVDRLADRVVVLRDGAVAGRFDSAGIDEDDVLEALVGRHIERSTRTPTAPRARPLLQLAGVTAPGLEEVSLEVAVGEVLALVGLTGAGHRRVGRVVAGIDRAGGGSMVLDDTPYRPRDPRDAQLRGVAYLAPDRQVQGGFQSLDTGTNYLARGSRRAALVRPRRDRALVRSRLEEWRVVPPTPEAPFASLSGGNQQRVLLAKWMDWQPRVLVVDEPTAGVDVGAKTAIHRRLAEAAAQGLSTLVISSDPDEVASVAHRVLVFAEGRVVCELSRRDLSADRVAGECYRAAAFSP